MTTTTNKKTSNSNELSSSLSSPAHAFNLYGWKPDPAISEDENYLDIVCIITRSIQQDNDDTDNQQKQGHMGALIVRPKEDNASGSNNNGIISYEHDFFQRILGAATNTPIFGTKECTSDIHAEINALGQVCKSCQSTQDCTAYITIHPCKRCFAALVTFGIKRIVIHRPTIPLLIRDTAFQRGIETKHLSYEESQNQVQRIDNLIKSQRSDEDIIKQQQIVKQQRLERKLARKVNKMTTTTNNHDKI
jgi:deoxycytidylate deaminase